MSRTLLLALLFAFVVSSVRADVPDAAQASKEKPAAETASGQKPPAKKQTRSWAQITIKGAYREGASTPSLFGSVSESLTEAIARLERAATDKRVSGLLLKIEGPSLGRAKLAEFQRAIAKFREQGKPVYAWLADGSSSGYLLATACDEIVMPESGTLMLLGVRAEVTFYKNLFDKLAIQPEMLRVGEYKSAAEPYTRTEMSEPFRREMEAIIDDYYRQMVVTIAKSRKLKKKQVKKAIDSGPHMARQAKELGLITRVAYEDELEELLKLHHPDAGVAFLRDYGKKKVDTDFSGLSGMVKMMNLMMGIESQPVASNRPKIAVIHANGAITTGSSTADLFGGEVLGSRTLIKAIHQANEDEKVKAIVLRINSPGGSALASDLIWNALEKVDKPFVASMGDVAASGGYYIAMGADRIFAEQGTLTGSIGVVGGKLAVKGLMEKIGVTTSVVSRGKNSGIFSSSPFTDSERASMVKTLNAVYGQFTQKAARGRRMKVEELEKLARGRVYTGRQALKVKLVDEIGSLDDAIAYAKKAAGLDDDDKVDQLILPRPMSPFEQLFGRPASDAKLQESAATLRSALTMLPPAVAEQFKRAWLVNLLAREKTLTLMPFHVRVD
jgi:protease-4